MMRALSKELQRFAARPANWWVAAVMLAYVFVALVASLWDGTHPTLASRIDDGTLATSTLAFGLLAAVVAILLMTTTAGQTRAALADDPRRDRLYVVKAAAAALAAVGGVVVAYGLFVAGLWAAHLLLGGVYEPGGLADGPAVAAALGRIGLRLVWLTVCAAVLGVGLGAMTGRWWTALIVMNVAIVAIERALYWAGARGWSLLLQVREWVAGPVSGMESVAVGPWWVGGLYVTVLAVGATAGGFVVFRRRNF